VPDAEMQSDPSSSLPPKQGRRAPTAFHTASKQVWLCAKMSSGEAYRSNAVRKY
jgi:hypothetical protein